MQQTTMDLSKMLHEDYLPIVFKRGKHELRLGWLTAKTRFGVCMNPYIRPYVRSVVTERKLRLVGFEPVKNTSSRGLYIAHNVQLDGFGVVDVIVKFNTGCVSEIVFVEPNDGQPIDRRLKTIDREEWYQRLEKLLNVERQQLGIDHCNNVWEGSYLTFDHGMCKLITMPSTRYEHWLIKDAIHYVEDAYDLEADDNGERYNVNGVELRGVLINFTLPWHTTADPSIFRK